MKSDGWTKRSKTLEIFINKAFMPYEPLHHKYRPQTFGDLVGQEAIATTLTNAIQQERIAPAYLFTGPRGTGKTSSARILAKSLNCLSSQVPTEKPCGTCQVCREIAQGSTLDVIEIDAASNTGVDNIRDLIERAQFAPVQCRYKAYIIDEVHMLSTAAFNALLKTLEEPPKHVVFILATTDPQRVLPTIISRCQRFDFRRIPLDAMVKHLRKIALKESINITVDSLTLVAQVAQGGLRDAESLLDQLSLLSGQVTIERVWDLVGAVPERDLMELLCAIASNTPSSVLDITRHLMDRGREPIIVLQNLAGFYRDLLIAKTAPSRPDLVACTDETWNLLCEFATKWEIPIILAGQKHLKDSEVQIKNTTQPRLWLEVTLLGLLPEALNNQFTVSSPESGKNNPQKNGNAVAKNLGIQQQQMTANGIYQTQKFSPEIVSIPAENSPPPVQPETPQPTNNYGKTQQNGYASHPPKSNPESSISQQPEPIEVAPTPPISQLDNGGSAPQFEIEQIWQQVIAQIQPPSTQALVNQHCRLLAFDETMARVVISSQPLLKLAQSKLSNIEAAFVKVFNRKVKVQIEVAASAHKNTKTNGQRSRAPETPPQESLPEENAPSRSSPDVVQNAPPPVSYNPPPVEVEKPPLSPVLPVAESSVTDVAPDTEIQTTEEEVDEVAIASQRLAEFFKGKVVKLTDDLTLSDPVVIDNPLPDFKPQDLKSTAELEGIEDVSDDYDDF